jgi:hypothetical protein
MADPAAAAPAANTLSLRLLLLTRLLVLLAVQVFPEDAPLLRHLEAAVLAAIERESEPLPL